MSIMEAPGVNASNTASFAFPQELEGQWLGTGRNWVPGCEEYAIELFMEGCGQYDDECGIAGYPPTFGSLSYVAPVDCVDYLLGDSPTGRCFQFMENFKGSAEIQNFFWYSDVILSEQTDATFFWAYMSGTIATAFGTIRRAADGEIVPGDSMPLSSFAEQHTNMLSLAALSDIEDPTPELPLGMILGPDPDQNAFPSSLGGAWSSDKVDNFFGSFKGTDVQVTFADDGCDVFNFLCATVSFSEESISAVYIAPSVCTASTSGPSPTGACYLFNGNIYLDYLFPDRWNRDSVAFYTISEQSSGDLWFTWHYGPVVKANGLLTRD